MTTTTTVTNQNGEHLREMADVRNESELGSRCYGVMSVQVTDELIAALQHVNGSLLPANVAVDLLALQITAMAMRRQAALS